MAKAGNNAAYKQLRSFGGGISDDIKHWREDAKYQEQKKISAEQEQHRREQAEKKRKTDLHTKYFKPGKLSDTGNKSLNEVLGSYVQKLKTEEYPKLLKQLQDSEEGSPEYLKATIALDNLNKAPERLKMVTDNIKSQVGEHQQKLSEGSIWDEPENLNKFNKDFASLELASDDNGNFMIGFIDKNNDGVNDYNDVVSFDEIAQGYNPFANQPRYDIDNLAEGLSDKIGKEDTTSFDGDFDSTQIKQIKLDAVDREVDSVLALDKGGSAVFNSLIREQGFNNDEEGQSQAKAFLKQKIIDNSDFFKKEDVDNSGRASRTSAAAALKRARNSGKEPKIVKIPEGVTPTEKTWGKETISTIDTSKVNSVYVGNQKVVIPSLPVSEGDSLTDASIENITRNKSGDLVVDAVYVESKSSKISEGEIEKLSKVVNDENSTDEEKRNAESKLSSSVNKGVKKVRKTVTVSKEDESAVLSRLQDGTEDKIYKQQGTTYKGIDEDGNPIYE